MADGGRIDVEFTDAVAWVTIDNPGQANALTAGMITALTTAWADVEARADVRVAVLGAAGERHFCAGAVYDVLAAGAVEGRPLHFSPRQCGVTKPVITALNGAVVGGALSLVTDADVVLASRSASLVEPHLTLGLATGYAALQLARILPPGEARRLVLGGHAAPLSAERAHTLGVVNELLDDRAALMQRAGELAEAIAAASPTALRLSLHYLRALAHGDEALLADAADAARRHRDHPDAAEGIRARAEGRAPRWA